MHVKCEFLIFQGPQIVNEENMPDVDMANAQDSTNFKVYNSAND